MALFNKKTIEKHLGSVQPIPAEHLGIITNWVSQIQNGTLARLNEIEVHASFTAQIMCKLLGYSAVGEAENYTVAREYPIARGKVDIAINTLGSHIEQQFKVLFADYGRYKTDDGAIVWKKGKQTELRFWYAWQDVLKQIKIVDPACGSGAFLIAAFDYLYGEYEKTNNQIAELTGQRSVLDLSKEILNNNLYGVDINAESIEITKLSLWLKTAERGKALEKMRNAISTGKEITDTAEKHIPDGAFL